MRLVSLVNNPHWLTALAFTFACGNSPSTSSGQGGNSGGSGAQTGGTANGGSGGTTQTTDNAPLLLNEAQSSNTGTWIDQTGETDDWLELVNVSDGPVQLSDYWLEDNAAERVQLPALNLAPGETHLLWADDDESQGDDHLPFKLSSQGDSLKLTDHQGNAVDEVSLPALQPNEVYARMGDSGAWQRCQFASPLQQNPSQCAPPEPAWLADNISFADYALPGSQFDPPSPLSISEVSLRPRTGEQAFVELVNTGEVAISLSQYQMRLNEHAPHLAWPEVGAGIVLSLGSDLLRPGQQVSIPVPAIAVAALNESEAFEGVVSLYGQDEIAVDRVDFMRWPPGATLARVDGGLLRLCTNSTPNETNECQPLAQREVGSRLRHLLTPGDFDALSSGATTVGIVSVKFVVDLEAPELVHLLSVANYPLHYTFVREQVYRQPTLDRCDSVEGAEFYSGWVEFSRTEYYATEGRRFLLGTLSRHTAAELSAVEYTLGDVIPAEQMRLGFLRAIAHTHDPLAWQLHPQDEGQSDKVRVLEGTVPLMSPNAPFQNLKHQALSEGVGFGTLRFVPTSQLGRTALGPEVIVVTDSVPNDIPLVGGLITEAFQTPLAHVNVLSQSRGTPNASLRNARIELSEWFDRLVRVEVSSNGVNVTAAKLDEATAYWEQFRQGEATLRPRIDLTTRGVQPLSEHGLASLPALGAKAAQLAELLQIGTPSCGSQASVRTPESAFGLPVVHFVEHFSQSGAADKLAELEAKTEFVADPLQRAQGLAEVRSLITSHPVEAALLEQVRSTVQAAFGEDRVRFRSSSNTEDLPNFIGAGLYDSESAEWGSENRPVANALRTVWASLYNPRAYDERRLAGVVESDVAMGVLVHRAFRNERANGVAVSRNLLDPIRGDIYYLNAQAGEASVTNPAPGISTEQLIYRWGRIPPILQKSQSSLLAALPSGVERVLSDLEVEDIACALRSVHQQFSPLLDPQSENPWFAMEVEFKYLGDERTLLLKQARPHDFGRAPEFTDCREF